MVARGDTESEEVSISSTFGMALVMVAPLGFALVAQAVAVLCDDVRRRAPPYKAAFNVAQYTLTLTAARVVYAATSGRSILSDTAPFEARDLLPALLGGLAFLLVNNGLLSIVMALASGTRIRGMVLEEARFLVTSAIVLSLAPVVTAAISFSIWLIPLLLPPIIAVHKAAGLSIRANGRRCTTR